MTPLHLAAKQGHLRVLNALKGSVDLKVCSRKTGFTALHVAAANGQIDFVSEMLTQTPAGILSERPLADPSADVSIVFESHVRIMSIRLIKIHSTLFNSMESLRFI